MATFRIVIEVLASVFLVILILDIGSMISAITEYVKVKMNKVETSIENDLSGMMNDITLFFKMVDDMVVNETQTVFRDYVTKKVEYDLRRLDDDAKSIASKVFNGINKDIMLRADNIINDTYIMTYIVNKSIDSLLLSNEELNQYIRS